MLFDSIGVAPQPCDHELSLALKTWSSLRAVSPMGWKLGQVRDNWLCRESRCKRDRNDGILECWNIEDPRLAE